MFFHWLKKRICALLFLSSFVFSYSSVVFFLSGFAKTAYILYFNEARKVVDRGQKYFSRSFIILSLLYDDVNKKNSDLSKMYMGMRYEAVEEYTK